MVRSRLTDLTASATIKVMPGEIALPRSPHDENWLVSVEQSGGALLSPVLTTFVYDGLGCLREQLQWTGSSDLSRSMEGLPRESKARRTRAVNNLTGTETLQAGSSHAFSRGNGNVTYLVNSSQTLTASYRYHPFGSLISSSGTLASTNTYRFSSKEFIPSASCYYYLYRFYGASLQRWLNRDPLGETITMNLYDYVDNDPSSLLIDPDGAQIVYVPPKGSDQGDNGSGVWNNPPAYSATIPNPPGCQSNADVGKVRKQHKTYHSCPACSTTYSCDAGERCTITAAAFGQNKMSWVPFEVNCTFCPGGG
jgi:RHS repeat-associated protein